MVAAIDWVSFGLAVGALALSVLQWLTRPWQDKRIAERVGRREIEYAAVLELVELTVVPRNNVRNLVTSQAEDPEGTSAGSHWGNITQALGALEQEWDRRLDFRVHSRPVRASVGELLRQAKRTHQVFKLGAIPHPEGFWSEVEALHESLNKLIRKGRRHLNPKGPVLE